MDPELVRLERHNQGHGQGGALSHVVFENGSVASIPQREQGLLIAVMATRMGIR